MPEGERLCKCGCGRSLEGRRPQAVYFGGACRAAHARAEGRGCFAPSRTKETARKEHTKPARRSPRPGVSVYFQDPAHLRAALAAVALRQEHDELDGGAWEAMHKALERHERKAKA
jgi:hypothetical protein